MGQIVENVQLKFKNSSSSLMLFFFRLVSGGALGLTFALIGEGIVGYGNLMFAFVITMVTGVFIRVSRNWGVFGVILFDLMFVLAGVSLRMYILMAPGS